MVKWQQTGLKGLKVGRWWRSPLRRFLSLLLVGLSLGLAIAACSGSSNLTPDGKPKKVEISLVSFAVTKEAHDAIIPKFAAKWKQEHGQDVVFYQSYGGSGSQTRAVVDGLEADVVHLALALDVEKLVSAQLIAPGWEQELPNNSIVSKSVAALVTREGNPKNIQSFADLARGDVKWITADPKTSGVARWNFLALWNAGVKAGGSDAAATQFVTEAYKNVPILTRDAREAADVFLKQEQGDAMVNYENEVLLAAQKGESSSYFIPDINVSIDNPIAVVDKIVDQRGSREVAEAFVQYLFTPEAQAEFAKVGFRPADALTVKDQTLVAPYKPVPTLSTVETYGGWATVQKKFFDNGALFDEIRRQLTAWMEGRSPHA